MAAETEVGTTSRTKILTVTQKVEETTTILHASIKDIPTITQIAMETMEIVAEEEEARNIHVIPAKKLVHLTLNYFNIKKALMARFGSEEVNIMRKVLMEIKGFTKVRLTRSCMTVLMELNGSQEREPC